MNYLNTICTCLLICLTLNLQAQEFPYFFSVENQMYADLEGATSLTGDIAWDDPEMAVEIGFEIELFGQTYTNLYFYGVGAQLVGTTELSSPFLYFIPYFSDIIDRGYGGDMSLSSINYKLEGTPGNQVFHLEWKNVGFYNEMDELGTTNDFVNFQLRLYEGSNNIEIHFGPNSVLNPELVHEDNSGPSCLFAENFVDDETTFDVAYGAIGEPHEATILQIFDLYNGLPSLEKDPEDGTVFVYSTSDLTSTKHPNELENSLQVYPTLVNNFVQVKLNTASNIRSAELKVINELGQVLLQQTLENNQDRIDLSQLSTGVYFISVQTENGQAMKRVVKG